MPYSDNPLLVTHFHLRTKSKLQRNLKLSSVCLSVSQLLGLEAWAITLCWLPWFWQLLTMCLVPLTFKKGGTSLSEHLHQTWGLFLLVFFLWGRVHRPQATVVRIWCFMVSSGNLFLFDFWLWNTRTLLFCVVNCSFSSTLYRYLMYLNDKSS